MKVAIRKDIIVEYAEALVLAMLAGMCISLAAMAYLAIENTVVGALFFTVGLFIILNFKFNLYTGKLCYVFSNDWKYGVKLAVIYIGNFVGTNLTALLFSATRLERLEARCVAIAETKLGDSLISLFILAIFCNILIYVAVEGFKSENPLTKYIALFFGVSVFVICGFEHSVADMFYFAFAGKYSGRAFLCLLIISLGNFVGGVLFELVKLAFKKLKSKN